MTNIFQNIIYIIRFIDILQVFIKKGICDELGS